jgi:SAM-dependent methyltransferase
MLGIAANRLRTIDKISLLHWDITQPFPVKNWQMVDVVTLFSVLPYVRNWDGFFTELQKVLKPGGIFIASFPNQLFDLYSLNSLTKDLFLSELVDPLVDPNVREDLVCTLKKRLGEPAAFPENSAYKNVDLYFKRANPLTISKELAPYGIQIERIYYMNNHPVPPSCDMRFGENLLALRKKRELDLDYEHWSQMFTNSTFLVAGEFRRFC